MVRIYGNTPLWLAATESGTRLMLRSISRYNRIKMNIINNNINTTYFSFSPRWNEEHTFAVNLPEISMLEIVVYDKDMATRDDTLGYAYLPLEHVEQGYRNVPLCNKEGAPLHPANLFVHVQRSVDLRRRTSMKTSDIKHLHISETVHTLSHHSNA